MRGSGLALDGVRDGRGDAGHTEEVPLGLFDALRDRQGHLAGLAVADADHTVAVADDDERGEAEAKKVSHEENAKRRAKSDEIMEKPVKVGDDLVDGLRDRADG